MYAYNNQPFDINVARILNDTLYPAGWFSSQAERDAHGIEEVVVTPAPKAFAGQKAVVSSFLRGEDGRLSTVWVIEPLTASETNAQNQAFTEAKLQRVSLINAWRAEANQSSFPFEGKQIACDQLSRSDLDGVASHVLLFGEFPEGFPNAWKAIDNTYVPLPTVDTFKSMYAAMTRQGTINFARSQQLKALVAAAADVSEVNAVTW